MTGMDASDEATGLPSLVELTQENSMLGVAFNVSHGLVGVGSAEKKTPQSVRILHVRGLVEREDAVVEWSQVHICIPVESCVEVAAMLAKGTLGDIA